MKLWGLLQLAALVLLPLGLVRASDGNAPSARLAGYIQSVRPADRTLLIEEVGRGVAATALQVQIRNADVVRVWRDPADPWVWKERPTSIYRWPVGTFVVVIGRARASGIVEASRIEIPKITSE